jgi:predicted aspartyl protease
VAFTLTFDHFAEYDAGLPGITLEVVLRFGNESVDVIAKIDTGSTDCIFVRSVAERLGIDLESGEPIRFATATGDFQAFRHEITLVVLGREMDTAVYFAQDPAFNRNVLGRHGFLDRTVLGLVDYEGRLYLNKYGN